MAKRWAEIAAFIAHPVGDGSYALDDDLTAVAGESALSHLIEVATTEERYADALDAARQARERCPHGYALGADPFAWELNDFVECWAVCPEFVLCGWHGRVFCVAMRAHGLPGGSLLVELEDVAL